MVLIDAAIRQYDERRAVIDGVVDFIEHGLHGGFPANEMIRIYDSIFSFLDSNIN